LLEENGRGERVFFPSHSNGHQAWNIPMATKHGTFQWPPSMGSSNGHQAWNIPMATKHGTFQWPPSMGSSIDHQAKNLLLLLPLATKQRSFTFSLKDGLGSWEGILFPPKKKTISIQS
jgi:hypothetical protein